MTVKKPPKPKKPAPAVTPVVASTRHGGARPLPSNARWPTTPMGQLVCAAGYGNAQALADALGYSRDQIRYIMLGWRLPSLEALYRLHDHTGLEWGAIMEAFRGPLETRVAGKAA